MTTLVLSLLPGMVRAQTIGSCQDAVSISFLDVNNVRAPVHNNGLLFQGAGYEVPVGGRVISIYSSALVMAGLVDGEIRGSVTRFSPNFWAGPVFPGVTAPSNCDRFDRIYKINREDIVSYESGGPTSTDLREWPTGLGAPTINAQGNRIVLQSNNVLAHIDTSGTIVGEEVLSFEDRLERIIDLDGGERPDLLGDQMLWWIMNDLGNIHNYGDPAMGVEIHATAFGFNVPGAIGNSTFYKYRIIYHAKQPLEQTYLGIFVDADLGFSDDDFIGVDTTLGLGYFYNADNEDEGNKGYGTAPPAVGYDFFQGPLVNSDGIDNDRDGTIDEVDERLKMTGYVRGFRGGGDLEEDPYNVPDYYNVLQGLWKDGVPITIGGIGRDFSTTRTTFQFSGAAERREFWSEINTDGQGTSNVLWDRRSYISSGPFSMQPGDDQEIVFGIVWSRGADHLDSVRQLKEDDALAQALFDIDFAVPAPPAAPRVTATPVDGGVILEWNYEPTDNNFLDAYSALDPLLSPDVADKDYEFEGYRVYQYTDPGDQAGKLLATYDAINGITRVIEGTDLTYVSAEGTDNGIQHSHFVDELTNYKTYFFGVQAYAYNATSGQKIYGGPVAKVEVVPTRVDARDSGTMLQTVLDVDIVAEVVTGATDGNAGARIVNPAAITGHEYQVVFREDTLAASGASVVTYDIIDADTGEKKFDGREALRMIEGRRPITDPNEWVTFSQHDNIAVIDGLEFDINGPQPGFKWFYVTHNANGPIDPWTGGAAVFRGFPVPNQEFRPPGQQANGSVWFLHTGRDFSSFEQFTARVARNDNFSRIVPYDWEMRFMGSTTCWPIFGLKNGSRVEAPFELWRTGIGTPDDSTDDTRITCLIFESFGGTAFGGTEDGVFDIGLDSPLSGRDNDPYTDWIYWYVPEDESPGDAGYQADLAEIVNGTYQRGSGEALARTVLVNWNGGSEPPYNADLPEPGTIFRIESTKPNSPGLIFGIDTAGHEVMKGVETVALSALEQIGIVPNPYKGTSAYEVSQRTDEVRFTNMPTQATIRVFDLAGTLVRRMEKNSPEAFFRWNLKTDEDLPIASGIYFIHIDVPDLGERALKFAVVRKGTRIQTF